MPNKTGNMFAISPVVTEYQCKESNQAQRADDIGSICAASLLVKLQTQFPAFIRSCGPVHEPPYIAIKFFPDHLF